MIKGKKFLITGGTGSLGKSLTKKLLASGADTVRILSRNESKQIEMENEINDDRLRFFIGDIRDEARLQSAFEDVDIIYHAAALKHVPKIEYNPFEAIKTNVIGSQNVINASLNQDVEKVICVGTDKAVSPQNTYGATKLIMEKLFVSANNYINNEKHRTKFTALRYGNVLGSSGSVIPKFIEQIKKNQPIYITDERMTRFTITMEEALEFILNVTEISKGSEIFVPKLNSYDMDLLTSTLNEIIGLKEKQIIGIRPGEKLHESLINSDELSYTYELEGYYVILSPHVTKFHSDKIQNIYPGITKITDMNAYSSDTVSCISKEDLKRKILNLNLINP